MYTKMGELFTPLAMRTDYLSVYLRQRLERRARDCARSVRPSRAANNDPHPRAPGALALSLMKGRGIWKWAEKGKKEESERDRRRNQKI
jgi:hypothetical protein